MKRLWKKAGDAWFVFWRAGLFMLALAAFAGLICWLTKPSFDRLFGITR